MNPTTEFAPRRFPRLLLPLLGLALAAISVLVAAQVRGRAAVAAAKEVPTAAPAPAGIAAEGRVVTYPGAEVIVGTDVAGTVIRLAVQELDRVEKGQLLAEIRADDVVAARDEVRGRIGEAEADLRLAQAEHERQKTLLEAGIGTRQAVDGSQRNVEAAQARLASQHSAERRLRAELAKTRLVAPIAGTVITRTADVGESFQSGDALLTLADLRRVRIEAEVDEFDAGHVTLGSAVTVTAEGWEGKSWRGHVEEIPDAVLPRRIEPQDPGRPTDTRVLRVKIALDEPTPLKLGQRVEVKIAG